MKQPDTGKERGLPARIFALVAILVAFDVAAATLEGTVRSSSSVPLAAMTVAAYDASGSVVASATTDSKGAYKTSFPGGRIRVLAFDPAGQYATTFSNGAESYETSPEVNVGSGDTVRTDFQMPLASAIIGTVFVANVPAQGVTVAAYNLSGTRRGFTRTTGNGTFSLVVPSGSFKLVAYDDAGTLAPIFYASKVSFGDADVVTVKAPAGAVADFTLAPAGFLGGIVVDRATNTGLSSMTVYAYTASGNLGSTTTTNPSGRFRLSLPAGAYRLVAADPSGTYATAFSGDAITFDSAPLTTVTASQSAPDANLVMDRGGRVAGRVTDTAGRPVASARVTAYNIDGTVRTQLQADANGAYTLVLPSGSFKLAAWDDDVTFVPSFYQQRRDFAGASPVGITTGQLAGGFDFSLEKAGRFSGTVSDAGSGTPLPAMTVAAYDNNFAVVATAPTDATGQYKLGVPGGSYRLVAWDNGRTYAAAYDGGVSTMESTTPRTISAEQTQSASFSMRRGILVSGKVITTSAAPVGGVEVLALDTAGNHVAGGTSASDGSFAIPLLPASYKFLVNDPARRYAAAYYDRAADLVSAGTVVVSTSGPPAPLTIVVSAPSRRRAAGH